MLQQNISLENLAVIIIHMQDNFLGIHKHLIPNHIAIIRFCRKNNIPVVISETRSGRYPMRTTDLILQEINKIPEQNLFWNADCKMDTLSNPEVPLFLENKKRNTILLTGVRAGDCVWATGKTSIEKYKYHLVTSADLMSGYSTHENSPCKDATWFKENGTYLENYNQIIQMLIGEF